MCTATWVLAEPCLGLEVSALPTRSSLRQGLGREPSLVAGGNNVTDIKGKKTKITDKDGEGDSCHVLREQEARER